MIGIIAGRVLDTVCFMSLHILSHPIEMILPVTFPPDDGIKFIDIKDWQVMVEYWVC